MIPLLVSTGLMLLSGLTVFQAPVRALWIPALFVTEWGHWIALLSIVAILFMGSPTLPGKISKVFLLITSVLCLTPLWRASAVSHQTGYRISGLTLFAGSSLPPIQPEVHEFSRMGNLRLSLDLYRLPSTRRLPVVVVVHGGSWQSGDRDEFPQLNRSLTGQGYAVASVSYRLAPQWTFPDARSDVESAIAWLRANAAQLNLDSDRIVLLGRSAGGQLALAAAYHNPQPWLRGVIAFYAPNDLVFGYNNPGNLRILNSKKLISQYLGGTPSELPGRYAEASPLTLVGPQTPPTLLIHGMRDEMVWPLHSIRLTERLEQARRPVTFLALPWATHGCDANFNGPSGQLSTRAVERFLNDVLSKGEPHA